MICLKRFNIFNQKIHTFISFDESLNINGEVFNLTGFVVHIGGSCDFGHYISFNKDSEGVWRRYDDSFVSVVSKQELLRQLPYILFFSREKGRKSSIDFVKQERKASLLVIEEEIKEEVTELINFKSKNLRRLEKILLEPQLLSTKRCREEVEDWGEEESKVHSQAVRSLKVKKQAEKNKYDMELDVGRQKKIKKKKERQMKNVFDEASKRNKSSI